MCASPSRNVIRDLDLVTACSVLLLVRTVTHKDLKYISVRKYKERAKCQWQQTANGCIKGRKCLCQPTPSEIRSQQGEFDPPCFCSRLTESCDLPLWCSSKQAPNSFARYGFGYDAIKVVLMLIPLFLVAVFDMLDCIFLPPRWFSMRISTLQSQALKWRAPSAKVQHGPISGGWHGRLGSWDPLENHPWAAQHSTAAGSFGNGISMRLGLNISFIVYS